MVSQQAEAGYGVALQAQLERMFLEEYLQRSGHSLAGLRGLPAEPMKRLMTAASLDASARLSEVETRARFVRDVHGRV